MPEDRYMTQLDMPSIGPMSPDLLADLLDDMQREQSQRAQSTKKSPFMLIPPFKGSIKRGANPRQYQQPMDNTT
jgi:hypothetical protein